MRLIYIFSLIFFLFIISCSRSNSVNLTVVLSGKTHFEISLANTNELLDSGDKMINDAEIPVVKSYQSTGYQKATLNKLKIGQKNTLSN